MFSSTPTTDPEPKSLGNLNADDFNSNQQLVAVTYLAGRNLIAGQNFTPVYNHYVKPIKTKTGKDSTGTTGYTDYGTFGLLLHIGGRSRWTNSSASSSTPSSSGKTPPAFPSA
jgi:hypothetical protein